MAIEKVMALAVTVVMEVILAQVSQTAQNNDRAQ